MTIKIFPFLETLITMKKYNLAFTPKMMEKLLPYVKKKIAKGLTEEKRKFAKMKKVSTGVSFGVALGAILEAIGRHFLICLCSPFSNLFVFLFDLLAFY